MENNKSYYAIIPATVRYDKKLNANAKLLYGEITALCNQEGYCWAGNSYFANLYDVSKVTISRWIKSLIECQYIESEIIYKKGSREIEQRRIYIKPYNQNCIAPINNIDKGGINKNVKDNNTIINTTINKDIYSSAKAKPEIPYKEIIDYLNKRTGKKYKHTASGNKIKIKARWNEGYTLEDFKKVIDVKVNQWSKDKKMQQYLRPNTLFSNKFDNYLNEEIKENGNKQGNAEQSHWEVL